MPTLDDALVVPTLTATTLVATNPTETETTLDELDLIQVYDVSSGKPKVITIASFATALGITI